MANRINTFLIKRSNTPGKIPTAGSLLLGELALNTADAKLYTSGTTANSILPIGWDRVSKTGDTMTGTLYVPTISATTYQGLPKDVYVTGGTVAGSVATFVNNTGGTFNVTGFTTPFTGGTVAGPTTFTGGLTANTLSATSINKVDYIVFNTGMTNPVTQAGTIFFNNTEQSLAYNASLNQLVTVNMGQQLYTRVYNVSGGQLDKGTIVSISGTINNLPSAIKSVNTHTITSIRPVGLAAENIPNNSSGLVLNNGILSGITINTFNNGDTLYLSPFSAGTYITDTSSFPFTARTNEIGYVIQTGTTTGKIYVNINNEDNNLFLSDIERNVLEGNVISTGVFSFSGITLGTGNTFNVSSAKGWIVDNTTNPLQPDAKYINYSGQTGLTTPYLLTDTETYILLNSGNTLTLINVFPTPQQRRQNLYLGKLGHGNKTNLINAFNEADFDISPISQLRDMFTPIKLINSGIIPTPNGANLNFNTSAGTLWGMGIGFTTNQLNPNSISISGSSPTTFQYRTQTGGTASNTTTVVPGNYDLNGVVTAIGSPAKQATNQRIYLLQNGNFRIQYGQTIYGDLTAAIAGAQSETFNTFTNFRDNAILIGFLSLRSDTTNLSDPLYAKFSFTSKFGELLGGTGGLSTTTLQQAYNNSTTPEILTNSTLGALSIQNGSGNADNVTKLFEAQNTSGNTTAFIRADGYISGSTIQTNGAYINNNGVTGTTVSATTYYNLPTDIRVTGGTYSNGITTFTNNTGGTFTVTGLTTPFTGGTVTGATNFTGGLSANTISATTFFNLPTDIRVTGGTYAAGTATFTNNTGGTFTVTGFSSSSSTFTGGTVTGATNFTGGLTANTISATTYFNLPIDVRVTGSSYSNNVFTYTNNTGGTFNVLFNTMTGLTVNGTLSATTLTVSGNSTLNGGISSTSLSGTTNRIVQVSTGGTVTATIPIITAYLTSGATTANLLETTSNWDINGNYTGTTITGTYQGQKHYNGDYLFEAVADNLFIRLIRG